MINFTVSISICEAQQSRAHSHAHSLRFTTVQVLKESSGIDQPQCGQEWFSEFSVSATHIKLIASASSEANQVRSAFSHLKGACQSSDINNGLTWLKSKGVSVKGPCTCSEDIIISPSLDHLSKSRFQPTFDSAVLLSLPLRDFGFSSPVIVIVKIHFII